MIQPKMIEAVKKVFPDLTDKQIEVVTLYSLGNSYAAIADSCNISTEAVRSQLKRTTKEMDLKTNDALRSVFLSRIFFLMVSCMQDTK